MLEVVVFINFFVVFCYTVKKMELLNTVYGSIQLALVAVFTYFFMLLKGVNKMVDVVTNRMFDTFNRFAPRDAPQNESLATLTTLKRFAADQRQKKSLIRDAEIKAKESKLFDIKENTSQAVLPNSRPLMGLSCYNCTPASKNHLVNKTTKYLALRNILNYKLPNHKNGLLHRTFSHFCQVYELKKFDYPQVASRVLKDERLRRAVEKTAIQQFQDADQSDDEFFQRLVKNNEKRARKLLKDMRSTLSDFLLRFTSWVLYKLLPMFLSSVVVHPGQVEMLKEAGSGKLPLIFLPLHRSHLDYILISFILLNNNVRSPLVAAGDNLRIPFFGSLLRGLGAFFIKRRIDPIMGRKDYVYKTVLHTYMNECLRAGHNIEFFLEGGRTRTGKPCMPKYGILSVIVDAFIDGTIEDALLVPVSVNYEKLVDGNFIREQLGQPKEMETFGNAIQGIWHVLNSNYGMMRIDFNQPFSLKELVKTFNTSLKVQTKGPKKLISNPSTTSLYGTDVVSDEHKSLVESISKHVLYDCAKSTSVMSTNAIAFLLLNRFRNGVTIEHLVAALDELRSELGNSGRDIGFSGESVDIVNYAIDMLGPSLVHKQRINNEEVVKPNAMLPNVIELSYYSNTLITYYALESIVAIAITMLMESSNTIVQQELVETISNLCDLLQYEFILCKPCQTLETAIFDCLEDLTLRKEIFVTKNNNSVDVMKSQRLAQQLTGDDSDEELDQVTYEVNAKASVIEHLNFLRGLLMPLIEAYSTTAFCLKKLIGKTMLESELVKKVLDEMKLQLGSGALTYEESVSVDPVKNALKLYQKWEILECHTENRMRLFYLKENEDNSESVDLLYSRINKYRISASDEI